MDRNQKILAKITPASQIGIEIGPLCSPIVTREMGAIRYVDHDSTAGLRAKYAHISAVNIDQIVEVDYVWGDKRLSELVGGDARVDYVIASHVIEHVPDLIGWLQEIHQILKPGGILSLVIPDKRFCFDYFRHPTRPADVIDAYLREARKPSPRQIFDHLASAVKWHEQISWSVLPNEVELVPVHTEKQAWQNAKDSHTDSSYRDVHCWVFIPESFIGILKSLVQLDLFQYKVVTFFKTVGCEFHVSLEALDGTVDIDQRQQMQFESLPQFQPAQVDPLTNSMIAPAFTSHTNLSLTTRLKQKLPPAIKQRIKSFLGR